jgi:hypothetical protein
LPINLGPNFDDPYNKYEGDYIIRVHGFNYREKTGPSKYTLKVKLYEGTKSEREYTYQGTITSGNQQIDSKSPFTGSDWDEAATISLTKEEFRSVYGTQ